jgi:prevent-host-death family protein
VDLRSRFGRIGFISIDFLLNSDYNFTKIMLFEVSMSIPIRELKANLSQVLSRAQAGEVIEVTSHKKPIARIVGIPPGAHSGLRRLIGMGAMSWGGDKPEFAAPVKLGAGGASLSRMVLEDRG